MTADQLLQEAALTIKQRASQRDIQSGERSMARCVAAYNAMTGQALTERDGWYFMLCLKYARSQQGIYNADDYQDAIAYSALLAEAALKAVNVSHLPLRS